MLVSYVLIPLYLEIWNHMNMISYVYFEMIY